MGDVRQNRSFWIGIAAIVVVAILGLWWTSASGPLNLSLGGFDTGSSTETSSGESISVATANHPTDVLSIMEGTVGTSKFSLLLSSTGVSSELKGKGPYTVFVPTDGAFSLLPAGTISKLTATQLKRLIEYHVVVGRKLDPDGVRSGSIAALSKDVLNFNVGTDMTSRVGSAIIIKAYPAENGIVYIIAGVLIPPKTK